VNLTTLHPSPFASKVLVMFARVVPIAARRPRDAKNAARPCRVMEKNSVGVRGLPSPDGEREMASTTAHRAGEETPGRGWASYGQLPLNDPEIERPRLKLKK
jgi:hypothetical protein